MSGPGTFEVVKMRAGRRGISPSPSSSCSAWEVIVSIASSLSGLFALTLAMIVLLDWTVAGYCSTGIGGRGRSRSEFPMRRNWIRCFHGFSYSSLMMMVVRVSMRVVGMVRMRM